MKSELLVPHLLPTSIIIFVILDDFVPNMSLQNFNIFGLSENITYTFVYLHLLVSWLPIFLLKLNAHLVPLTH